MSKPFSNKRPRMNDNTEIKPENMPISFSENDFTFTRTNFPLPFVTKLKINDWTNNWNVHRVSINTGSRADILYMSLFSKFRLSKSMLKPCDAYLKSVIGFGQGASVKGYIDLDTTFGTKPNAKTIEVRYFVVDDSQSASAYNVVIGLPALKDLKAVISIEDHTVEFPIGKGKVGVVKGDLEMAKNCCGFDVTLPMVIKLQINNNTVLRVSVNEGSSANILYWSAFLKMGLGESMLKPFEGFLKGTFGEGVPVKGYVDLDTTFGKGGNVKMIKVRYFVIDSWSVYNVVIGLPAVADLGAVISTLHLTMKYPLRDGMVGVVKADLKMAKKCCEMCPMAV